MTDNASNVERLVLTAIEAVQSGDRARVESAYEAIERVDGLDVFTELIVFLHDCTDGVDLTELLGAATLPLPPEPRRVLAAVANCDFGAVKQATGSDSLELVLATLFVLAASLGDARQRL